MKGNLIDKRLLTLLPLAILLATTMLVYIQPKTSWLVLAVGSSPDSYGNMIHEVFFQQWNGTDWVAIDDAWSHDGNNGYYAGASSWNTYASGFTVTVNASTEVRFGIYVLLNDTLASSTAEALTNTRVYLNVSKGETFYLTNQEMNDDSGSNTDTGVYYCWYVEMWNGTATGHPLEGNTYDVSYRYQAYY